MPRPPAELDKTRDLVDVGLDASPAATDVKQPSSSVTGSDSSSALFNHGRFLPGTLLADRYRIVALAGTGGMGEVYRADDLRLGQTVALKFLPERLLKDGPSLARFHSEVRLARQVAHPNVCRVYDIGEVDGQTFLSMEYIDGEDLASLLRRIGRFPQDKALEMTRQLVSGLAAAHEKGVLHRDLKPANVMIDGRGKAVLTDFGLAVFIDRHDQLTERAGTPAYMAPEQLEGKGVTARSDLYSLGLILHEIFTGRQVYAGESLADVLKQRLDSSTASSTNLPSSILPDLDPVVERVILQCLERDPSRRPSSALALLTALPGGNPLAAALAAGETPSPELVAACGNNACFCPYRATAAAAILLVGLIAIAVLSKWTSAINLMSPEKPPAELAGHARDLIRELGYPTPKDVAYGYSSDLGYVPHVEKSDRSAGRWTDLKQARTTLSYFWYRQSPAELVPSAFYASPFGNAGVATGQVTGADPGADRPGMVSVQTDMHGRLLLFRANPTNVATDASTPNKGAIDPFLNLKTGPGVRNVEPVPPVPGPRDVRATPAISATWQSLFEAAGLDTLGATEVEPTLPPPVFGDRRKAWLVKSQDDHRELRVEAAALDGKPVYFQVVLPWQSTGNPNEIAGRGKTARLILYGQNGLLLIAGIFFAWRNLRSGRGDRRGALRLGTYVFLVLMLAWAFSASHTPSHVELDLLYLGLARALFSAGLVWLFYIALETYVRRLWPEVLISWSRLLSGNWRDSLVGRDVLIGTLAGVSFVVLERAGMMLTPLLGLPASAPIMPLPGTLQGASASVGTLLVMHVNSIHVSLFAVLLFLLILRIIFRRPMVAAAALVVFITTIMAMMTGHPAVSFAVYGIGISLLVFVLVRFGLLAVITLLQVRALCLYPITLDTNAWYFGAGALAIALIVSLALYGLFTFMPTRATLFRDDLLAPR